MTGFPINPPRTQMVDAARNVTPEWYRFFAAIQKLIGGASNPFDDTVYLSQKASPPPDAPGVSAIPAPPAQAAPANDLGAYPPPSHFVVGADLLVPYPRPQTEVIESRPIRSVTASGNVELFDRVILVDTTAGAVTMTLPALATCLGRVFDIKKIDAVANNMVIDGNGAETIDGAANITTATQWASYTVIASSSGWMIL